jgi:hypothetical protein
MSFGQQVRNRWTALKREVFDRDTLRAIAKEQGEWVRILTVGRTLSGRTRDGKPFAKYKPSYAEVRREKGLQISPVNLKVSGRMLNSLKVTKIKVAGKAGDSIEISFDLVVGSRHEQQAFGLSTGFLGKTRRPARQFIGLAPYGGPLRRAQESALRKIAANHIKFNAKAKGVFITEDLR